MITKDGKTYVEVSNARGSRVVLIDEAEWRDAGVDLIDEVKYPSVQSPWAQKPTYEQLEAELTVTRNRITELETSLAGHLDKAIAILAVTP